MSEPLLLAGTDTARPVLIDLGPGRAAALTRPRPGRQGPNEDAVAALPVDRQRAVLAVADGLGGHLAGELASRLVLEELESAVTGCTGDGLRGAILDAIERGNRRLLAEFPGSGTTLVVAEIDGRLVRPYHVGDSAALVFGQRGRIKLRTVDHSPVGYALEAGVMDEHEAMRHDERHVVSNVVGIEEMRIEVGAPIELAPRDTLLLASDGLADNLTTEEIVGLARCGPLGRAAERLLDAASERMSAPGGRSPSKPDDLSFVLYRPGASAGVAG